MRRLCTVHTLRVFRSARLGGRQVPSRSVSTVIFHCFLSLFFKFSTINFSICPQHLSNNFNRKCFIAISTNFLNSLLQNYPVQSKFSSTKIPVTFNKRLRLRRPVYILQLVPCFMIFKAHNPLRGFQKVQYKLYSQLGCFRFRVLVLFYINNKNMRCSVFKSFGSMGFHGCCHIKSQNLTNRSTGLPCSSALLRNFMRCFQVSPSALRLPNQRGQQGVMCCSYPSFFLT